MKPFAKVALALVLVALGPLVSCRTPWEPTVRDSVVVSIEKMHAEGQLTTEQRDAMLQAVGELSDGVSFEEILGWLGSSLGSVLLALFGVQKIRGAAKPTDREGALILQGIIERERRRLKAADGAPVA